jgi:hypothetical protein
MLATPAIPPVPTPLLPVELDEVEAVRGVVKSCWMRFTPWFEAPPGNAGAPGVPAIADCGKFGPVAPGIPPGNGFWPIGAGINCPFGPI